MNKETLKELHRMLGQLEETGSFVPGLAHEYNGGEAGESYRAAIIFAARHHKQFLKLRVTHGLALVTDPDSENFYERVPHAWVEAYGRDGNHEVWHVYDASNSKNETVACMKRKSYHEAFRVKFAKCHRYCFSEALSLSKLVGHCGPWMSPMEETPFWTDADRARVSVTNHPVAAGDIP